MTFVKEERHCQRPHTASCISTRLAYLRFPYFPQEVLVFVAERPTWAGQLGTAPVHRGARADRPVVSRPDTAAVQVFSTVRHDWRPLADDRPKLTIELPQALRAIARRSNMGLFILRHLLRCSMRFEGHRLSRVSKHIDEMNTHRH